MANADDFISKPVRLKERIARIESGTRRARDPHPSSPAFELQGLRVDLASRRIYLYATPVKLITKDFDLAALVLGNVGRLFTRSQISEAIWGDKGLVRSRTVDTHISRVRTKLWSDRKQRT